MIGFGASKKSGSIVFKLSKIFVPLCMTVTCPYSSEGSAEKCKMINNVLMHIEETTEPVRFLIT